MKVCNLCVLVALLVVAGIVALAGRVATPQQADAASALPLVQHQEVCAADAAGGAARHHAAVVIVFPDGTDTYCVSFEEDELSGAELLERTGLPLVLSGFGGLGAGVCRIDDVGCTDPGDCFCQCHGADCHYWTYYELDGASWRFLPVGASQRRVHDGDVDGWVWGNGHTVPSQVDVALLCSSLQPTPVPTATPLPSSGSARATATLPSQASAPARTSGDGGVPGMAGGPRPTTSAGNTATAALPAAAAVMTATSQPEVVRQSSRPTKPEAEDVPNDAGGDGGAPVGLIGFAATAVLIGVVAGTVLVRNRVHGR